VPRFGYAAAAWTTFISFFVYAVFVLFTGRRLVPWTVTSKSVVFDTGISVVGMSLAVLIRFQMVGLPSTMRLVVAGSVAAATVAFVGVRLARSGEFGPIGGGHNGKSGR